jgi:hypothetical protein
MSPNLRTFLNTVVVMPLQVLSATKFQRNFYGTISYRTQERVPIK